MSRMIANLTLVAFLAVCIAASPARAQAQAAKVGGQPSGENLSGQEREILSIANEFARQAVAVLDRWIAGKEVTEEKLFARLYYPIAKTDPPKFATDYDRLAERDIQPLGEAVLSKAAAIVFASIYDLNCYNPTHNLKFSAQPTGNSAVDLMASRQKWITQSHTALISARNNAPFIIQTYQRDTGELMGELAVPLIVRGQHWGAVRIGYRQLVDTPKALAVAPPK